jgi:hypothetical protein
LGLNLGIVVQITSQFAMSMTLRLLVAIASTRAKHTSPMYVFQIQGECFFGDRATCRSFLEKITKDILKFQKILKKIPTVDNDVIYQRAKTELEIHNI